VGKKYKYNKRNNNSENFRGARLLPGEPTILSRNLDQNMLKQALLFGKSWKNCRSVRATPLNPS